MLATMKITPILAGLVSLATGAIPDKCPVVTLPQALTDGGGGDPAGIDQSCQAACLELKPACNHLSEPAMDIGSPFTISRNGGICNPGPMGMIPPVENMVSSLIVEPVDGFFTPDKFHGLPFARVIVARTLNFLNVRVQHQRLFDEDDIEPEIRISQSYRDITPLLNGNKLSAGFMVALFEGIDPQTNVLKNRPGRNDFALEMPLFRTTWDRDTHYGRHNGPRVRTGGFFRLCTKLYSVTGQSFLHPVARHAPVSDCIRMRFERIPDPPRVQQRVHGNTW